MDLDDLLDSALEDLEEEEKKEEQTKTEENPETLNTDSLKDELTKILNDENIQENNNALPTNLQEELTKLLDEPLPDDMLKAFEGADWENAIEGLTEQLLSKEVLYDPMKAMKEKFPEWIKKNTPKLSEEELKGYQKQYEFSCKICEVYETEGSDIKEVLTLMEEMQDCGSPPQELLDSIMGDLKINDDTQQPPLDPSLFQGLFGNPNNQASQAENPCPVQ